MYSVGIILMLLISASKLSFWQMPYGEIAGLSVAHYHDRLFTFIGVSRAIEATVVPKLFFGKQLSCFSVGRKRMTKEGESIFCRRSRSDRKNEKRSSDQLKCYDKEKHFQIVLCQFIECLFTIKVFSPLKIKTFYHFAIVQQFFSSVFPLLQTWSGLRTQTRFSNCLKGF